MSFSLKRSFDNRRDVRNMRLPTIKGRTWTRRIQRLEDDGIIKLKMEDGEVYKEVLAGATDVETIYKRFMQGQSIDDCISILGSKVPESLQSRRAKND